MSTLAYAIEEETLPQYDPKKYYPVSLGEILHERYRVVAKLGFGSQSTIWLAQDVKRWRIQRDRFVTIKVLTTQAIANQSAAPELAMSQLIANTNPWHQGLQYLRIVQESFEIKGPYGNHLCLVYVPMRETISTFQQRTKDERIPSDLLKILFEFLLTGLDYLHRDCHIIHTNIKSDNILLAIEHNGIIKELIEEENQHSTLAKVCDDRNIYFGRNFGDFRGAPGRPKLADFGHDHNTSW